MGCAFTVLNSLGVGFLERVYENALSFELRDAGFAVVQQPGTKVMYRGAAVGEYFADLLAGGSVAVELKAVKALDDAHRRQCIDFLKATGLHLCLLLNFGTPRLDIMRVVNRL